MVLINVFVVVLFFLTHVVFMRGAPNLFTAEVVPVRMCTLAVLCPFKAALLSHWRGDVIAAKPPPSLSLRAG